MSVLSPALDRSRQIAILNDAFRLTFLGGTVCVTAGLMLLGEETVARALSAVREFDHFPGDDDPYGEHDFGAFAIADRKLFWKIDYFDPTMTAGSSDPADLTVTRRVLTVMLAEDW